MQVNNMGNLAQLMGGMEEGSPAMKKMMLLKELLNPGQTQVQKGDSSISDSKRRLRDHIARLQREHRAMQERCDTLAEALGACYCWGDDPGCDACQGSGGPGATAPDSHAFEQIVMPVLVRLGLIEDESEEEIGDMTESLSGLTDGVDDLEDRLNN